MRRRRRWRRRGWGLLRGGPRSALPGAAAASVNGPAHVPSGAAPRVLMGRRQRLPTASSKWAAAAIPMDGWPTKSTWGARRSGLAGPRSMPPPPAPRVNGRGGAGRAGGGGSAAHSGCPKTLKLWQLRSIQYICAGKAI